jgi:hypothetical protein
MVRRDGYVPVDKSWPRAGFKYGMTDEEYHADPIPDGSLSSTFARLLTAHVPAKALERRDRKPTKAMNLGKAAHRQALGTGPELVVWEHDGRTKEGKAERAARAFDIEAERAVAVTPAERDQVVGMAEALRADPVVSKILDASQAEASAFWQESGVWCRARIDLLDERDALDYKTTQDVSLRGFSKAMGSYGYHQQADFYQRGLRALGHSAADFPFRFICQETEPPYLIQIHQPDEMAMEVARVLNDRALRIYAEAKASGVWPGYLTTEATDAAPLPAYYFYEHEAALPDEWRVTSAEMVI